MQVKHFDNHSPALLEKAINVWFDSNPDINIYNITFYMSPSINYHHAWIAYDEPEEGEDE